MTPTLQVNIPDEQKFGFNTTPTQTVGTTKVDPSMDPYGVGSSPTQSTPSPTVAPEPTVGQTLEGIKTQAAVIQAELDKRKALEGLTYDTTKNPYDAAIVPIDEKAIARQQMKLFQKEIDATNRVYQDILNKERLAGQGRLGTQTAMAARGGLLGSDFGEAQRQTQLSANSEVERSIQNERLAKIGTIMGTMRKAVADEIANKRLARTQDADTYVKYLAAGKERKQANARIAAGALIDSGIDPASLTPEELSAIGKEANLSTQDILAEYNAIKSGQAESDLKTRKTEAEINKIDADIASGKLKTIGEGTMLYDTETGETFKNPKTYAPTSGTGLKIGGQSVDPSVVTNTHQKLDDLRGEDGYTDTLKYQQELSSFVELGGDPKDFVKEFDPNIYINPNDPTRSFLQAYMKKTPEEQALSDAEELTATINTLNTLKGNN